MIDEQQINAVLDQTLDLVDEGKDLSAGHLALVKENGEAVLCCHELLNLKAAARYAAGETDVEARLQAMHDRLGIKPRRSYKARIMAFIVAAAAVFIGILVYMNLPEPRTEDELYTAVTDPGPVIISGSKGEKVQVKAAKTQCYTISVADYRKVMTDEKNVEKVMVTVPDGKTAHVNLPDGSVVYLHPGTRLRIPTEFIGDKRFVMVDGEAYFKVRHDGAKPFIVQTGDIETTVLGTEFNVKGNTVTLINGKVRITGNNIRESLTMYPGHQASVVDDRLRVAVVDTLPYVYWRDGYLYYDNMEISDVMKGIGRYFNMTVRCGNSAVMKQRMRFIAERDKGVDAALEMMNRMGKVRVYRKENQIFVE